MARQSSDSRTGERVTKTDEQWRSELTREQYDVLRRVGTERAGTGRYAYSKDAGTTAAPPAALRCSTPAPSTTPAPGGRPSRSR